MFAGDSALEDFFTEEYALNHLIHHLSQALTSRFMDGVVMGGGMGISQGARLRVVTEHTKMAMPETNIGLFPDVGGGYFLGALPRPCCGEYLALTGQVIGAGEAMASGLADVKVDAASLPALVGGPGRTRLSVQPRPPRHWDRAQWTPGRTRPAEGRQRWIDSYFSLLRVRRIVDALEASPDPWAARTAATCASARR